MHFWKRAARAAVISILVSSSASAGTEVVRYRLDNVWLDPDISGFSGPRQMTGSFEWTYQTGDFENGSGDFIEIGLPWGAFSISQLGFNIENTAIEITLNGNFHDLGVDISLFLIEPLSQGAGSEIDLVRSAFQIEQGVSYQGHVISGSVVIEPPACIADLSGDGILDLADVTMFASSFIAGEAAADIAVPFGVLDLSDISAFVNNFIAGCPE